MNLPDLEASADRLAGLQQLADAERETRDELIRKHMDAPGAEYGPVARAARLSPGQVARIITKD
ncbi:MAG: hypothetical protein JWP34_4530 [Massilia sp.]|nr:hypothetical protein [Gemmatimonadales bacterium]MDB5910416.1 hypothetical protein [Massilia sp.]